MVAGGGGWISGVAGLPAKLKPGTAASRSVRKGLGEPGSVPQPGVPGPVRMGGVLHGLGVCLHTEIATWMKYRRARRDPTAGPLGGEPQFCLSVPIPG